MNRISKYASRGPVSLLLCTLLLPGCAGIASLADRMGGAPPQPLVLYGFNAAVELAPIHLAARALYGEDAVIHHGGVADLAGPEPKGDVASNAEAPFLRISAADPEVRSILAVAEGHYPIVARRSAGIESVADLKGKRVLHSSVDIPTTSTYFLHKMLAREGLSLSDVTLVITPLGKIAEGMANKQFDATAIWEPDSESSIRALRDMGEDVVVFSGAGLYHESYNLYTRTDVLADPVKRRELVKLVRAIMDATEAINTDPAIAAEAQAIVAKSGGLYTVDEIARSWPNVRFVASFDDDLLDILAEEEVWLAAQQNRKARTREELAPLIDRSIYEEALAAKP